MVTISITAARWSASKRVEAIAIADYRSPRNATRSRNGNTALGWTSWKLIARTISPTHSSKFLEYSLLSQDRVKLRTSNFLSTPYYLRNGWSYELQIWQVYSQGPSEQKPIKNFGEKGAWAYPGTAEIFSVPPISSGTSNATSFKFCTHILSIGRYKSPLQISGKVAVGVVRTLEIFQGTHILGASRGRLWDSSAFLLDSYLDIARYRKRVLWWLCSTAVWRLFCRISSS